jgi:hypothetical protein
MRKIYLATFLLLGTLTACNDWNEQLDIQYEPTDVKSINFTLENSAYATIAGLQANKDLALAQDPDGGSYTERLAAIGSNKYFMSDADAELFLPAYLKSKYPNSSKSSKFVITYNLYSKPADYLSDFSSMDTYTVTADDYATVWGDAIKASFLSPNSLKQIPSLLKAAVPDAAEGDMRVVNYAYSQTEPSSGGSSEGPVEIVYDPISSVLAATGDYNVKGEVVGTYQRGFLVQDETGTVLVYTNQDVPNVSVGDVVGVKGSTSKYSGYMQFANAEISFLERKTTFAYPTTATDISGDVDGWATSNAPMTYAKIKGTLSISGTYYNITVAGATRQGSISYPAPGLVDAALDGQEVELTGYVIGIQSKYVNFMATSLTAAGAAPEYTPVGVVALAAPGAYKVKGSVVATYARGFLLNDGTGSILVYLQSAAGFTDGMYAVGDVVTVEGTTSAYGGLNQFPNSSVVTIVSTGNTFKQPTERVWTVEDMTAYVQAPYAAYISYVGTLSVSGSYYNITIEGLDGTQGSPQYLSGDLKAKFDELNGKKIVVTGYSIGTSSGTKYINTMATAVEEASAAATTRLAAVTRAAGDAQPNASALYRYDGTAWSLYTNDEVTVNVVDPLTYAQLGTDVIAKPAAILPLYLANVYPLAADKTRVAVVYNATSGLTAEEYILNKGVWAPRPTSSNSIIIFEQGDLDYTRQPTTYLDANFEGGNNGGFIFKDIKLPGGSTYVWKFDEAYGYMKASAYVSSVNYESDSYLVSPAIELGDAIAPVLTFREAHRYLGGSEVPDDRFFVYISDTYEADAEINPSDWTLLPVTGWSDGASWTFVNLDPIDLSAYTGKTVHIAFRYTSVDGSAATWEVDDVLVQEAVQ